jgi:hypothetical protein
MSLLHHFPVKLYNNNPVLKLRIQPIHLYISLCK